jgi:ABC-type amino acid transport substrate-binding protein
VSKERGMIGKNQIRLTGLSAALVLVLAGCAGGEGDAAAFTESEKFVIGSDLTYPPYAYMEAGEPAGFDAEIGRALAQEMDRDVEFKDTRFDQLIPGLRSGHFDAIISSLYITAERAELVDYVPYFMTGTSIIAPAGGTFKPKTPEDLCGKRIASIKGSAILPALRGEVSEECESAGGKPLDVREFPTDPEASQALLSGQADVHMTEAAVAKVSVEKSNGKLEITSNELLYPIAVGIGVEKGNDEVVEDLEGALERMKESGDYQRLLDKYNLQAPDPSLVESSLEGDPDA